MMRGWHTTLNSLPYLLPFVVLTLVARGPLLTAMTLRELVWIDRLFFCSTLLVVTLGQ